MLENDTSAIAVGKRLRYVRQLAGLSREDLAKQASVGRTSISYWEHATDETGPMTSRSMAKILKSIQEAGVDCTERWLRSGTGAAPKLVDHSIMAANTSIKLEQDNCVESADDLTMLLIANLSDEIKRFTSLSPLAVITKVDTHCMQPALEKGDYVGGIWQSSQKLEGEKLCILQINNQLQVRRIKRGTHHDTFNISYLIYDASQTEPFEIKDIKIEKIAPIIRLWR